MSAKSTKSADSSSLYGFAELIKLFEGAFYADSVIHVVGTIFTSCQVSSFDNTYLFRALMLLQAIQDESARMGFSGYLYHWHHDRYSRSNQGYSRFTLRGDQTGF